MFDVLLVADTREAAVRAGVFARGDTRVVVWSQDDALDVGLDAVGGVVIACDMPQVAWLDPVVALVSAGVSPATEVQMVVGAGLDEEGVEALASAWAGWAVGGVAVLGDAVSLRLTRIEANLAAEMTHEAFAGASMLTEALSVLAGEPGEDAAWFGYRASLLTSYLRQLPRLYAVIEGLERNVRDLRSENRELRAIVSSRPVIPAEPPMPARAPSEERTSVIDPTVKVVPSGRSNRRRRAKKVALLAGAGVVYAGGALLVANWLDGGVELVVGILILGGLAFLALDQRRRAALMNRRVLTGIRDLRRSRSSMKGLQRSVETMGRQVQASVKASTSAAATASRELAEANRHVLAHQAEVGRSILDGVYGRLDRKLDESSTRVAETIERRTAEEIGKSRRELSTEISSVREAVSALPRLDGVHRVVRAEATLLYNQIESNLRLRDVVVSPGLTPPLRGWAASPDILAHLFKEIIVLRPRLIVECGSGASSVWMALACRSLEIDARVVAVDHDDSFARKTREWAEECGVSDIVDIRVAPLDEAQVQGAPWWWYATEAFEDLSDIGLLFVDGPPESAGELSRYPALPLLRSRLAEQATVVLDDLIRPDEKVIASRWQQEFPEFAYSELAVEKGAAVLRIG